MNKVLLLIALTLAALLAVPGTVAASAGSRTEAERVMAIAADQIGDRYAWAATGPNSFDCSGFVYYVFREAGLLDRVGGKRRTVAGYRKWFAANGSVTKSGARPGDVLIWGKNKHTGIYVGDGWAISALVNPYGVKLHKVDRISLRLTAVLRVNLER